jgi:hypothetical protein
VTLTSSGNFYGYPPYASNGCTLVYVNASSQLVRRDLGTKTEEVLSDAPSNPRKPTMSDDVTAWIEGTGDLRVVYGDQPYAITWHPERNKDEPRASGSALVFTDWVTATDSDVVLLELATNTYTVVGTGPAQQRFADVGDAFVAITDFTEDPDGIFNGDGTDLADIVIFDRTTRTSSTRALPGKQAFPVVADSTHFGYLDWGTVRPEPKFAAYDLHSGATTQPATSDTLVMSIEVTTGQEILPTARDGVLEWVSSDTNDGMMKLYRAPADGSSGPQQAYNNRSLTAPIASTV